MAESYVPDGSPPIVPYIVVNDGKAAIDFYQRAFGAKLTHDPIAMDDGRIGHAELRIGKAVFILADEFPEVGAISPATLGGSSVGVTVYVADCDALAKRAEAAGATIQAPPTNQFWGNRDVRIGCPFGHRWLFSTCVEHLTPDDRGARAADWIAEQ